MQDGQLQREVEIRVFDRRFTASKKQVEQNLTSANLTERGFKKTTLTQRVDVEEGEQLQKIVRFQKSVPCEDMAKVEEELRGSLPGAWGKAVSDEVRKEAMAKKGKNQHCTAGIEIHLSAQNCRKTKSKAKRSPWRPCKKRRRCMFCFLATVV